jgi:hypothetical protein
MYNAKAVITGIVVFLVLCTSPFWVNLFGTSYKQTGIVLPKSEKTCIEGTDLMRSQHMRLLNEWRDEALRHENREYVATDGRKWPISLQNTCLSGECHGNYKTFCEKCHLDNSVYPYCWTCHIIPQGGK